MEEMKQVANEGERTEKEHKAELGLFKSRALLEKSFELKPSNLIVPWSIHCRRFGGSLNAQSRSVLVPMLTSYRVSSREKPE